MSESVKPAGSSDALTWAILGAVVCGCVGWFGPEVFRIIEPFVHWPVRSAAAGWSSDPATQTAIGALATNIVTGLAVSLVAAFLETVARRRFSPLGIGCWLLTGVFAGALYWSIISIISLYLYQQDDFYPHLLWSGIWTLIGAIAGSDLSVLLHEQRTPKTPSTSP